MKNVIYYFHFDGNYYAGDHIDIHDNTSVNFYQGEYSRETTAHETCVEDVTLGSLDEPYIIQLNVAEGVENVQGNVQGIKVQKVLEDGIIYILRNGEKYDAKGKRVSEK